MIFHNRYTMSIDNMSSMLDSADPKLACRYPMPKFIAKYGFNRLMNDYQDLFNKDQISKMIKSDSYKLMMYHAVKNTLPALRSGVDMILKYEKHMDDEDIEMILESFKKRYGKLPESKEDLKRIDSDIRKRVSKLKEIDIPKEKSEHTFEDVISFVQTVNNLGYIDRSMSLFAFHKQYKNAIKKVNNGKR